MRRPWWRLRWEQIPGSVESSWAETRVQAALCPERGAGSRVSHRTGGNPLITCTRAHTRAHTYAANKYIHTHTHCRPGICCAGARPPTAAALQERRGLSLQAVSGHTAPPDRNSQAAGLRAPARLPRAAPPRQEDGAPGWRLSSSSPERRGCGGVDFRGVWGADALRLGVGTSESPGPGHGASGSTQAQSLAGSPGQVPSGLRAPLNPSPSPLRNDEAFSPSTGTAGCGGPAGSPGDPSAPRSARGLTPRLSESGLGVWPPVS